MHVAFAHSLSHWERRASASCVVGIGHVGFEPRSTALSPKLAGPTSLSPHGCDIEKGPRVCIPASCALCSLPRLPSTSSPHIVRNPQSKPACHPTTSCPLAWNPSPNRTHYWSSSPPGASARSLTRGCTALGGRGGRGTRRGGWGASRGRNLLRVVGECERDCMREVGGRKRGTASVSAKKAGRGLRTGRDGNVHHASRSRR